jgi:putative membrane protein
MQKRFFKFGGVAGGAVLALGLVAFAQDRPATADPQQRGATGQTGTGQSGTDQSGTGQTGSGRTGTGQTGTMDRSTGNANRIAASDSSFAMKAAMGGMAEVEHGKLASGKASNADVKTFADRMVADHTKSNDELKQIAQGKGITLPTSLDGKHQAMHDKLSKLSGDAFDREYMKHMVSSHREKANDFKKESERGSDPELKAFAAKTLPTIQEHQQLAESTNAKLKGGATKDTSK